MVETVPAQETIARLLLYRFLAKGYSYPEADLLEILSVEVVWEELALAGEVLGLETSPNLVELREWLDGYKGDEERLLLDLQIEHTYLFITARPHVPASPYESAYNGRGYLMGEPVSQVLAAYREAGLAMHKDYDALPDHFAAELEFLSYLIQQELEAVQAGDTASCRKLAGAPEPLPGGAPAPMGTALPGKGDSRCPQAVLQAAGRSRRDGSPARGAADAHDRPDLRFRIEFRFRGGKTWQQQC